MANVTIPYLEPGLAHFEQLDTYLSSFLLMGDTPRLMSYPMELAANVTLSQFQVVARNPAGKIVPATRVTPVHASRVLTFSGTGTANDTVTIAGQVYTLVAAPAAANQVLIGATAAATAANLAAAINGDGGTGYHSATVPNQVCYATVSAADVTVWARVPGIEGNSIAVAESGTGTAFASGATTLTGGVDAAPAIGVVTQAVTSGGVDVVTVPVFYAGNFNIDALVWHASFATDAQKLAAFMSAPAPTNIVVSKR